jgi:hypothetical protein
MRSPSGRNVKVQAGRGSSDPVYLSSLTGDVVWMEPPRREGALYGEEFHLQEAREAVARLTGR